MIGRRHGRYVVARILSVQAQADSKTGYHKDLGEHRLGNERVGQGRKGLRGREPFWKVGIGASCDDGLRWRALGAHGRRDTTFRLACPHYPNE